jgi:hypothetical protein
LEARERQQAASDAGDQSRRKPGSHPFSSRQKCLFRCRRMLRFSVEICWVTVFFGEDLKIKSVLIFLQKSTFISFCLQIFKTTKLKFFK